MLVLDGAGVVRRVHINQIHFVDLIPLAWLSYPGFMAYRSDPPKHPRSPLRYEDRRQRQRHKKVSHPLGRVIECQERAALIRNCLCPTMRRLGG